MGDYNKALFSLDGCSTIMESFFHITYAEVWCGMDVSANYFLIFQSVSSLKADDNKRRSNLESLFCYDKAIPEEIIEKPIGLSLDEKSIGNNPRCTDCEAKGAVLCVTCAGSGLYVDSILESQGIIVKVRCLGIFFFLF